MDVSLALQETLAQARPSASLIASCRQQLASHGVAVVPALFGDSGNVAAQLRAHALELFAAGRMRGGVVRKMTKGMAEEGAECSEVTRDDSVCWLRFDGTCDDCFGDESEGEAAETEDKAPLSPHAGLCTALVLAVGRLVRECVDPLLRPSLLMPAVYPPGRNGFKEHVDNPGGDGRIVTAVYYVNAGWKGEDGALLRAWTAGADSEGELVEVSPDADRLVLFFSERIRHEVTPNARLGASPEAHRCAYTLWYFREEQAVAYRATLRRRRKAGGARVARGPFVRRLLLSRRPRTRGGKEKAIR